MEFIAREVASVEWPSAGRLVVRQRGLHRDGGRVLVGIREEERLHVLDLDRVLSGDRRLAADFPMLGAEAWFTPDLTAVVFADVDRIVMGDRAGAVRWEWRHEKWDGGHSGSVLVTPDGAQVWAVAPVADDRMEWVVLDAGTGALLARTPLGWRTYGSFQIMAGDHVGVSNLHEDFCTIYLGRYQDDGLQVREVYSEEELLIDSTNQLMLVISAQHHSLELHELADPDTVVACVYPDSIAEHLAQSGEYGWNPYGGFVDATTAIASTTSYETDEIQQWLISVPETDNGRYVNNLPKGVLRGPVTYPMGEPSEAIWGLSDGTWITANDDTLTRWALA